MVSKPSALVGAAACNLPVATAVAVASDDPSVRLPSAHSSASDLSREIFSSSATAHVNAEGLRRSPPLIARFTRTPSQPGADSLNLADDILHVAIETAYGLENIKKALTHAAREDRRGKILLTPNGPL